MEQLDALDLEHCPVANVQKVIRGKWSMVILYFLSRGDSAVQPTET